MSNYDVYFREILMIKGKNPGGGGGLTPKEVVGNQTHFVFESYWVGPSIWPSFIQIESRLPGPLMDTVLKCY